VIPKLWVKLRGSCNEEHQSKQKTYSCGGTREGLILETALKLRLKKEPTISSEGEQYPWHKNAMRKSFGLEKSLMWPGTREI
jgi:hypothetical protein